MAPGSLSREPLRHDRLEPGNGFLQTGDAKDFLQFSVQTYMLAGIILAL